MLFLSGPILPEPKQTLKDFRTLTSNLLEDADLRVQKVRAVDARTRAAPTPVHW